MPRAPTSLPPPDAEKRLRGRSRNRETTRQQILDVAQEMVQLRGYHAFSYRDLAEVIGIKTSSIHYYFPTKGDLGRALMARYRGAFLEALVQIDREEKNAAEKLQRYLGLFSQTFERDHRLCLCGSLAADLSTLPDSIRDEARGFFDDNERWLQRVLHQGQEAGTLRIPGSVERAAETFFSALEGAMLGARTFGDPARIQTTGRWLLDTLTP